MRFPTINDVAAELREINKEGLEPDDADEGIDVRLQVYPDGSWIVRWGLPDYDPDHHGFWGASSVPGNNRRFSSKDVARDLIDQAKQDYAMDQGVDEARAAEPKVRSRRQPSLPGFPDIPETDMEIPKMPIWEQIDGDMDIAGHGGTLARSDDGAIELLKIQPVREYIGDGEAAEVGYPFWTREAYLDLDDLKKGMKEALDFIGMNEHDFEKLTPTQRALTVASAMLDYGHADEGPSGWSKDIYADAEVKDYRGNVTTIEDLLAEEDDEFRRDVLGWGDIREALEKTVQEMVDESAAQGWSQLDDQTMIDLEAKGFDDQSAFYIAEFGDAVAVNTDVLVHPDFAREIGIKSGEKILLWGDVGTSELESWLEKNGYEVTDFGGDVPGAEGYAYSEHVVDRVARELEVSKETVEEVTKTLDWWEDEIPGSTDGFTALWAKPVEAEEDLSEARRSPRRSDRPYFSPARGEDDNHGYAVKIDGIDNSFPSQPFGRRIEAMDAVKAFKAIAKKPVEEDLEERRDPWRGQPRRPALPDMRLIDELAGEVDRIRRERGITFEQAYDAISPKPDWFRRYYTRGGDKLYLENLIINRAKQIGRRRPGAAQEAGRPPPRRRPSPARRNPRRRR